MSTTPAHSSKPRASVRSRRLSFVQNSKTPCVFSAFIDRMIFSARDTIMFVPIRHIDDIKPHIANTPEINLREQNGVTLAIYAFSDTNTFNSPYALECRGIAFDKTGNIISRPLHKFFNVGEKADVSIDSVRNRSIVAVFEKLDGSMIATAWLDGELRFRSKGSFDSDVVRLTQNMVSTPQFAHIQEFSLLCAQNGLTAIFELTHPQARIVVNPGVENLRLLHVRDNITGAYVLLDPEHIVHQWIAQHNVEMVQRFSKTFDELLEDLETMEHQEGYVVQFDDGDMAKIKCPWYLRLHRSVTFLRERDIAALALHEELDDLKALLRTNNMDFFDIEEIETRLKNILLGYEQDISHLYETHKHLDKKGLAMALGKHPLFAHVVNKYIGNTSYLKEWYEKKHFKNDFSLRVINEGSTNDCSDD